jgi:hypothetical protein
MRGTLHRPLRTGAAAVLLALGAGAADIAGAQTRVPTGAGTATAPPARARAVSVSPLALMLGSYSADYEAAVAPHLSLGAGATYEDKHALFVSGESGYDFDASAKLRFYPNSAAIHGLSFGVLAGGTRYQRSRADTVGDFGDEQRTHTVATLGFTVDYNALPQADRRLLIGVGGGFKRRFVRASSSDWDRVTALRPTIRLVLGYAF